MLFNKSIFSIYSCFHHNRMGSICGSGLRAAEPGLCEVLAVEEDSISSIAPLSDDAVSSESIIEEIPLPLSGDEHPAHVLNKRSAMLCLN